MKIVALSKEEFDHFSYQHKYSTYYQTSSYAETSRYEGLNTFYIGFVENDELVGATLFLYKTVYLYYKYAYAPRGFLIDYNDFNLLETYTKEVKRYFNKNNIAAVRLSPYIIKTVYDLKYHVVTKNNYYNNILNSLNRLGYKHQGYNNFFEAIKPRYEAIIDLNVPYYILFKNINKQFRTKIRSAEKNGISVYKGDITNLNYLYLQTQKKYPRDLRYFEDTYNYWNKTGNIEFFYTKLDTRKYLEVTQAELQKQESIVNQINIDIRNKKSNKKTLINKKMEADRMVDKYRNQLVKATKLITKYPEGIVTSSAMVIKNNDEVHLLIDGYDPKFKVLNSKHLLIWSLCERYSKQGFKKFNLGGITAVDLKSNPYQGLNDFKLKFNALAIEYMGDLELVTNNAINFMKKNASILKR